MSSRRTSAAALLASLVLVVVSLAAWVGSPSSGVGTDLEQVTFPGSSAVTGATRSADAPPLATSRPPAASGSESTFGEVPVVDATRIEALVEAEPPRRLVIPSVDISMPVTATGVTTDGQMELPPDPREVGWYKFGALPGDSRGSAVLGGHVDSVRYGTGPLARLAKVRTGARITVTSPEGERLGYRVTSVERIAKSALPVDRLFDPSVPHRLVIVTCGGLYLPDSGGYEDNIVVVAEPVR